MPRLNITKEVSINEVANNLLKYKIDSPISVEELIQLASNLNPDEYMQLYNSDVLSMVKDPIPLQIFLILTEGTNLYIDYVISNCKLDEESIEYLIERQAEISYDIVTLIYQQALSTEQIISLLTNSNSTHRGHFFGEIVGEKKDVELAKAFIDNWSNLNVSETSFNQLVSFKATLFEAFGATIISTEDQIKIFGAVRPTMTSNELRSYDPCRLGWRRVVKWAGRSDQRYSWNEFVARHILANVNNLSEAKDDLTWLSSTLSSVSVQ
jgi:hypothetical protein